MSGVPQDLQVVPREARQRRTPEDQAGPEGALPEGRRRQMARAEDSREEEVALKETFLG